MKNNFHIEFPDLRGKTVCDFSGHYLGTVGMNNNHSLLVEKRVMKVGPVITRCMLSTSSIESMTETNIKLKPDQDDYWQMPYHMKFAS